MKVSEIREMTLDDLKLKVKDISKDLANLRFQNAMGQLSTPSKLSQLKKDIARIKTIIAEKGSEKRS